MGIYKVSNEKPNVKKQLRYILIAQSQSKGDETHDKTKVHAAERHFAEISVKVSF